MSSDHGQEEPIEYVLVVAYGARAARAARDVAAREQSWEMQVAAVEEPTELGPPRFDPFRLTPIVQIVDPDDDVLVEVAARHRRDVAPDHVVTLLLGAPRGSGDGDGDQGQTVASVPNDTHHADLVALLRALLAVPALAQHAEVTTTDDGISAVLEAGHWLDVAHGSGATAVGAMSEALARAAAGATPAVRAAYAAIELPEGTLCSASDAVRHLEAALHGEAPVFVSVSHGAPAGVALWLVSQEAARRPAKRAQLGRRQASKTQLLCQPKFDGDADTGPVGPAGPAGPADAIVKGGARRRRRAPAVPRLAHSIDNTAQNNGAADDDWLELDADRRSYVLTVLYHLAAEPKQPAAAPCARAFAAAVTALEGGARGDVSGWGLLDNYWRSYVDQGLSSLSHDLRTARTPSDGADSALRVVWERTCRAPPSHYAVAFDAARGFLRR